MISHLISRNQKVLYQNPGDFFLGKLAGVHPRFPACSAGRSWLHLGTGLNRSFASGPLCHSESLQNLGSSPGESEEIIIIQDGNIFVSRKISDIFYDIVHRLWYLIFGPKAIPSTFRSAIFTSKPQFPRITLQRSQRPKMQHLVSATVLAEGRADAPFFFRKQWVGWQHHHIITKTYEDNLGFY